MRILLILVMVLQGFSGLGQQTDANSPRLLLLDTTVNLAPAFNNAVLKYATGYRLIGSEKEAGSRIIYSFSDGREGVLHTEFKYEMQGGRQIVVYQSVKADLEVLMAVYNGLFRTNLAADIDHASNAGGVIEYHNRTYQCLMQADDYKQGYWVLSFVK